MLDPLLSIFLAVRPSLTTLFNLKIPPEISPIIKFLQIQVTADHVKEAARLMKVCCDLNNETSLSLTINICFNLYCFLYRTQQSLIDVTTTDVLLDDGEGEGRIWLYNSKLSFNRMYSSQLEKNLCWTCTGDDSSAAGGSGGPPGDDDAPGGGPSGASKDTPAPAPAPAVLCSVAFFLFHSFDLIFITFFSHYFIFQLVCI